MSRSKHSKHSSNVNKLTKEEYKSKIRSYNREQLHKAEQALDVDDIAFESSKNRFSDRWCWD